MTPLPDGAQPHPPAAGRPGARIKAIETRYAGCLFRSRLEARWAVFFDTFGINWEYEPQGFELPNGARYLPDFLLPDCGTWVEVKGHEAALDKQLLIEAARHLPHVHNKVGEPCGGLMILGPIPRVDPSGWDWGWPIIDSHDDTGHNRWVFGTYHKNRRPWWANPNTDILDTWTQPVLCDEYVDQAVDAYTAARSARFEHGQTVDRRRDR